jgi:putative oxidoreductase
MNYLAYILDILPKGLTIINYFNIFEVVATLIIIYLIIKKKYAIAEEVLVGILVVVFVYTPATKLMKYEEYILAMKAQPIAPTLQRFLIYAVPLTEFIAVILLAIPKLRTKGLYVSLAMLVVFTGYISLVQLNYYGRIPCSCGGIVQELGWEQHLIFNVFLIAVTVTALWTGQKITKKGKNEKDYKYQAG